MAQIYRFEDLRDLVALRAQFSAVKYEHDEVRIQLRRLSTYCPTKSHPEMIEDLINASELLAIEFNRLRQEVLQLKLEKIYDQQTARTYPLTNPCDLGGSVYTGGFDPSGGGR